MNKQIVAEKDHAVLGPSGWDRWSACPGSVPLSEGLPNNTSIYAATGTAMHEVGDRLLRGEIGNAEELVGEVFQIDGHDIVFDMELATAVNDYASAVYEFIDPSKGDILLPEQQVPIGHLTGETGAEGTSDCIGIVNDGKRLVVIDLKGGQGVAVSAIDNGQGRIYALGALEKFGMVYDEIEEIEIVIIQPRLDNGISSEIITVEQLREFASEVERAAGAVALAKAEVDTLLDFHGGEGDLEWARRYLNPGEKQCKFCRAKAICPALQAEVSSAMALATTCDAGDFADLSFPKQASSLVVDAEAPVDRLAAIMRAAPLIEDFLTAVRAEVERRLFDRQMVPGFYLGVGRQGNRQWAAEVLDPETKELKPVDIETELKKRLGAKDTYVKKVISPTEAEKKFKDKPRTWAKIAPFITRSEGKPSVCREGDKNPPYQLPSPDDFADLSASNVESNPLLD